MLGLARKITLLALLGVMTPIALVIGYARRRTRSTRCLWVVHPMPTIPALAEAERMLGCTVETWAFETGRLEHRFDKDLSSTRRQPFPGILTPFLHFLQAIASFDRLHFFCDRGLLPLFHPREFNPVELYLYRILGKQVFFWTYGADVRTRKATLKLGEPNACTSCPQIGRYCICNDQNGQRNQARLKRTAKAIFSIGDLKHYTPGSINNLFFWPVNLASDRYAPVFPEPISGRPVRVVHAPNHRHFKGTEHLINAVKTLNARGIPIELDLVEKLSNDQALDRYRAADIVFDQCLIGFHGYFALEAMALGKPVLCFVRNRAIDLLAPDECPIIEIKPETITQALENLVQNPDEIANLGRRGRAYIEQYYSIDAFAQRYRIALEKLGVTVS